MSWSPPFSPGFLEGGKKVLRPYVINRGILQVRATGRELVPATGPLLVAGNHSSWLDGPLVVIQSPRPVRCLTKVEMFTGPVGAFLRFVGQIPVDRGHPDRAALQEAVGELQRGGAVGVFPEGTRGTGELDVVHDGIAYLAVRAECPIVPVACLGTIDSLPPGAKWPRRVLVDVVFGKPFEVSLPENRRSRKALSALAQDIRERLVDHLAHARQVRAEYERAGVGAQDLAARS